MNTQMIAALLAITVGVTGCGSGKKPDPGGPSGYSVAGKELTENEFRYGLAPQQHKDVTLQPDVVLVGGGAGTVRSVTADGLTWTIDGKADRANDLAPGKVMFVTSRGVGRVVEVKPSGDNLAVTIAPVDITEVVKDGTFDGHQPTPPGSISASARSASQPDSTSD